MRAGDDYLNGGAGNDTLLGGTDKDILCGGSGNDLLGGGCDNDILDGGSGNDVLIGGNGNDIFRYCKADFSGIDTIVDFTKGMDRLAIEGFNFTKSGISYTNNNKTAVFDVNNDGKADLTINFSKAVSFGLSDADFKSVVI